MALGLRLVSCLALITFCLFFSRSHSYYCDSPRIAFGHKIIWSGPNGQSVGRLPGEFCIPEAMRPLTKLATTAHIRTEVGFLCIFGKEGRWLELN